jgi:hypothetical protein
MHGTGLSEIENNVATSVEANLSRLSCNLSHGENIVKWSMLERTYLVLEPRSS